MPAPDNAVPDVLGRCSVCDPFVDCGVVSAVEGENGVSMLLTREGGVGSADPGPEGVWISSVCPCGAMPPISLNMFSGIWGEDR